MHPENRLILALTTLLLALSAADARGQGVELGIHGGVAHSNEVTSQIEICAGYRCGPASMHPHYWRQAPTIGVVLRQQRRPALALRAEINLTQRGYGPGERSDAHVASRYLEAPLLAELRFGRAGPLQLQLGAGLAPALLLTCRYSNTDVRGFIEAGCDEISPWSDRSYGPTSSYDLAALLAPGLRLPTPGGSLALEIRYAHGLVDIRPDAPGKTTNRSRTASLAYAHRIGQAREPGR